MIAEKMQKQIDALRKQLAPVGAQLPPLVLPLIDGLESEVERVAGMEDSAVLNVEKETRARPAQIVTRGGW